MGFENIPIRIRHHEDKRASGKPLYPRSMTLRLTKSDISEAGSTLAHPERKDVSTAASET